MSPRTVAVLLLSTLILSGALLLAGSVVADAPANDDFDSATEIVLVDGSYDDVVDMAEATRADDDPDSGMCGFSSSVSTVWYAYTPAAEQALEISADGSDYAAGILVFTGTRGALDLAHCVTPWNTEALMVEGGTTYYLMAQFVDPYYGYDSGSPGAIQLHLAEIPPPANDNFADAAIVDPLPFSYDIDLRGATREADEPAGSCVYGDDSDQPTVWFAFTPGETGYYTMDLGGAYGWFIVTYRMAEPDSLLEISCVDLWGAAVSLPDLQAGETYYIQVSNREWYGTQATFHLDVPPDPVANFWWDPYEPSVFRDVHFYSDAYDPAYIGIASWRWDLGDGTVVEGPDQTHVSHRYGSDGDYVVSMEVTTFDSRTASHTTTIQVRTHDVGISRFRVPRTGIVGKTHQINVGLTNKRYGEWVYVELYRSSSYGFEQVASQHVWLPVAKNSSPTSSFVTFRYTFTPEDGLAGKVTFRAYVYIQDHEDAFPMDNEAMSLVVRVKR